MNMEKYTVAVCQMDSQDDKQANLRAAGEMIDENAAKGAKIIAFPETMNFMGKGQRYQAETIPGGTTDFLCGKAKEHGVWIVSGSFPERIESAGAALSGGQSGDEKPRNTLVLIDPQGKIRCKYSKIHMFDVEIANGPSYRESDHNTAGNEIVLADTELGRLGFAICYDLRFGEMFRLMALHGAQVIFIPSSFTMNTGKDHWETLLRARAIENGVYIVAPNQIGKKTNMIAYGKSMVIDPWGDVIARASDRPGSILAEIDPGYIERVRRQVPSLENRRADVYGELDRALEKVGVYSPV